MPILFYLILVAVSSQVTFHFGWFLLALLMSASVVARRHNNDW